MSDHLGQQAMTLNYLVVAKIMERSATNKENLSQ
jgi:hypothetical protein